jgi:hypothetical protein
MNGSGDPSPVQQDWLPAFFRGQKRLLEELFSPDWFNNPRPKHPAYLRWALCTRALKDGLRYPEDRNKFAMITRMWLDSNILTGVTGGDTEQVTLGSFKVYGDSSAAQKVKSEIYHPRKFEDVMVELSFAAGHIAKGHKITPLEENGFPDFIIDIAEIDCPIYTECKRVISESVDVRLPKSIQKANSQIKSIEDVRGPGYGLAVVDASVYSVPGSLTDEIPNQIGEIEKMIKSAITGNKNRSVGGVMLVWDEYNTVNEEGLPLVLLVTRRRRLFVPHSPNPDVLAIPVGLSLFDGQTGVLPLIVSKGSAPKL